jgi:Xaa-Pro aminopeptidase
MQLFDYGRASRLMHSAGIDVLLASSKHGVGYLTDYWHPVSDEYYVLWDTSATHMTLAGIPREQSKGPFIVAGASEQTTLALMDPWVKDRRFWGPGYYIQTWRNPRDPDPDPGDPMKVVAEALREKKLDRGVAGVESRYLGAKYVERLKELLPALRIVDAEPVLWGLRMIKHPEEIQRAREACVRTGRAWLNTVRRAQAGMTEQDMQREFMRECLDQKLDYERAYVIFGPAGLKLINGSATPRNNPLKEGQYIRIDAQGKFQGYICNLSRVVGFGEVSREMELAHALERSLVLDLIPEIRPGVVVSDIRKKELKLYEGTGYVPLIPYTGHGVGRVVHEPPYLALNDQTVLQPDMIVTLEPTICFSEGGDIFVSIEDQFLVTEAGSDWMTKDTPMDLYV